MIVVHRFIALLLGIAFALFAYWQLNDPDPWLWVPVYLLPALLSFSYFFGKPQRFFLMIGVVGYLIGAVLSFPPQWEGLGLDNLAMKTQNIELARESLGLGLVALVFLYYLAVYRRLV